MNVDAIYIISLKGDVSRRETLLKWLPMSENIHWYITKRHENGGTQGCYESHKAVIDDARQRSYKLVLIFEDDASPNKPWNDIVNIINESLTKLPSDFEIFTIGSVVSKTSTQVDKNIYKLKRGMCATAYIIKPDKVHMEDFKELLPDMYLFYPCKFNTYIYLPSLFGQTDAMTNIDDSYQYFKNSFLKMSSTEEFSNMARYIDPLMLFPLFIILAILLIVLACVKQKDKIYVGIFILFVLFIFILAIILDNCIQ